MIATIVLRLKIAIELFDESWQIKSLEFSTPDGILLLTSVLALQRPTVYLQYLHLHD